MYRDLNFTVYFLVRMMNFFLRPELFNKSISNYLERFKFSKFGIRIHHIWKEFTRTAKNFVAKIDEAEKAEIKTDEIKNLPSTYTIKQIMESWTTQNVTPLLTVTKTDHEQIIIKQVS